MIKNNIYDDISKREDGNFDVRINNSWGVVSQLAKTIIPVKYATKLPLQFANTIVESSYSHYKGVIDDKGKEKIPTIYEHLFKLDDLYIFGYGGHEEKEYNFFNKIRDAHWGCITLDGKIIIPPIYECIKLNDDFIIAGRDGQMTGDFDEYGTYFENDYEGTYDLYDKKGNLIFGGFSSFHFNANRNLFYFKFLSHERINNWLVVDSDFKSIRRTKEGSSIILPYGYIIEEFDDENLPLHIPRELYITSYPSVLFNFIMDKDCLIRIDDGYTIEENEIKPIGYDMFCYTYDYDFFGKSKTSIGITQLTYKTEKKEVYEDEIISPLLDGISIITLPKNGYVFAVTEKDDEFCSVDLYNINNDSNYITAINSIHIFELINLIAEGSLYITINKEEKDLKQIQVPDLSIFDDDFVNQISDIEKAVKFRKATCKYWFAVNDEEFESYIIPEEDDSDSY